MGWLESIPSGFSSESHSRCPGLPEDAAAATVAPIKTVHRMALRVQTCVILVQTTAGAPFPWKESYERDLFTDAMVTTAGDIPPNYGDEVSFAYGPLAGFSI